MIAAFEMSHLYSISIKHRRTTILGLVKRSFVKKMHSIVKIYTSHLDVIKVFILNTVLLIFLVF